jgi:hypothetical protein
MKTQTTKFFLTLFLLLGSVGEIFAQGEWFPSDKPNCVVWNPSPNRGETVTWSGDCVNGKAHGFGRTTWRFKQSGIWVERYIDGDMQLGQRLGQVTVTYEKGDLFVGMLDADGNRLQGAYYYSRGGRYIGDWKNSKKDGHGTEIRTNGETYVGGWKNNKEEGHGSFTSSKSHQYVGDWKNGKMSGKGIATFSTGAKHVGNFKDGKIHGQGVWTDVDGTQKEGIWKENKFQYVMLSPQPRSVEKTPNQATKMVPNSFEFRKLKTVKTNIEGVVLKKLLCHGSAYFGNVVNRTNQSLIGKYFEIESFDADGDPIDNCGKALNVGPKSGDGIILLSCSCDGAKKIRITIK